MSKRNTQLPMEVYNTPWLYEIQPNVRLVDVGKWMLFYDNSMMNHAWIKARKLFREDKLYGIASIKCSTSYNNPRSSSSYSGVIIFYCCNSSDQDVIMDIGLKLLNSMNYKEQKVIYYKTDEQTLKGTSATGATKNYTYRIYNHLYSPRRLLWVIKNVILTYSILSRDIC